MAAFLAPALGAPAATAATATAAPKPPDAIKRQFVAERGVKFTQITRDDDGDTIARGGGVFQFDRSGVIASDITTNFPDGKKGSFETLKAFFSPIRTIWVRGTAYSSGDLYENILDPGQKWLRVPEGSPIGFGNFLVDYVNILDPAALRTLLSQSASKRSPYRITTTYGRLHRLSPWFRTWGGKAKSSLADMKVNVTIHVDADGLPRRVVTSYKFSGGTVTTETRYTSWGTKVNIKAPHGVAVADGSDYSPR